MATLLAIRTDNADLNRELAISAAALGEFDVLDLTGTGAALGARRTYRVDAGAADLSTAVAAAHALQAAVREGGHDLVLTDAGWGGRELAGYLAALLDSSVITDAAAIRREDDGLVAERHVLAGTWDTTCALRRLPAVVALTPNVPDDASAPAGTSQDVALAVDLPAAASRVSVLARTPQALGEGVALESADIVVVAGRGTEGDFSQVRALADRLGAAVGATRVCTDEGWIEHTAQIGQTGVVIRPKIYIGLGVSGAVHHTVGMQNAEVIVAVNTDSEAPIFEIADFGIVGDLNEVVPQLLEALDGN